MKRGKLYACMPVMTHGIRIQLLTVRSFSLKIARKLYSEPRKLYSLDSDSIRQYRPDGLPWMPYVPSDHGLTLDDVRLHVLESLYYVSPATLLWLLPLAYQLEFRRMDTDEVRAALPHTWHWFALAAVVAVLVNTSSFLVIQRTNAVMLKLLAIARNALVVCSGIALYGDRITPVQLFGYVVTLFFFVVYTVLQFEIGLPRYRPVCCSGRSSRFSGRTRLSSDECDESH